MMIKMEEWSIRKERKVEKGVKTKFEIESFKCRENGHYAFECPSKNKN